MQKNFNDDQEEDNKCQLIVDDDCKHKKRDEKHYKSDELILGVKKWYEKKLHDINTKPLPPIDSRTLQDPTYVILPDRYRRS